MIGKEILSTKYYIAFNGDKIDTDPEYFESDDEAFKYFKDNTNVFLEKYNNGTGPNKFTIIEETATISEDNTTIPMSGTLCQIADVFGVKEDNSISWISNGIEYYVVSEDLSNDELVSIAKSMATLPVSK